MTQAIVPPPAWHPPSARELPALRQRLAEQTRNPTEIKVQTLLQADRRSSLSIPELPPEGAARFFLQDECARLDPAPCFSITKEMVDIARRSAANLPHWRIRYEDLPQPRRAHNPQSRLRKGFMVFDEPIAEYTSEPVYHPHPETVRVVAASWGPTKLSTHWGTDPTEHLWLTFWSVTNYGLIAQGYEQLRHLPPAEAQRTARKGFAPLRWDDEALLTLGSSRVRLSSEPQEVDLGAHMISPRLVEWVQIVRATWLLMKPESSITDVVPVDLRARDVPRVRGKRGERNRRDPEEVSIVRIHSSRRRTPAPPSGAPSPVGTVHAAPGNRYSVRHPISGHVRWQPYPSTGDIKPIWIDTFDRGPKGAPYRVGANYQVYKLDRAPEGFDPDRPEG